MNKLYDIIIIGSGPAGTSTALHLHRYAPGSGLATLILEKFQHPRQKLCAGGILTDGERVLSKLDLDLREVPHVDVEKALIHYKGRGVTGRLFNKAPIFRVVRRNEFDAWLAEKVKESGIEIREEITVKKVESFEEYALVKTNQGDFRAKVVVGADGSNSIVRRAVDKNPTSNVARALEVITPISSQLSPSREGLSQELASFDFLAIPKGISGYVWDFPALVKGKPMRCWGIYDSNVRSRPHREPLRQVLADEMAAHGYNLDDYELKGHPIRWYESTNQVSMPRVILVGDALGVDAVFGEGISPALGYGAVAAKAILHAFEQNDFSFESYRGRIMRSRLGGALWRRTFIAKLFYRLKSERLQSITWHYFGWLAGILGALFVVGWEKKKK